LKLLVLSDLHLELADFEPDSVSVEASDVVVLAGDIHQGTKGIAWARKTFPDKPIIYVAGNHEFYHFHWEKLLSDLREEAFNHEVHFLENDSVNIGAVRFLGATLWTDFDYLGRSRRSQAMREAENRLNDYRLITAGIPPSELIDIYQRKERMSVTVGPGRPYESELTAAHTIKRHQDSLEWLRNELPKGARSRTVVVTHHYPHQNSTAVRFQKDLLTPAFGSRLPIEMLTQASLWIHGHTHDSADYGITHGGNAVRVLCNPRGYPLGVRTAPFENPRFDSRRLVDLWRPE
jgi:Icc-related predicted phosphoesterase